MATTLTTRGNEMNYTKKDHTIGIINHQLASQLKEIKESKMDHRMKELTKSHLLSLADYREARNAFDTEGEEKASDENINRDMRRGNSFMIWVCGVCGERAIRIPKAKLCRGCKSEAAWMAQEAVMVEALARDESLSHEHIEKILWK